MKKISCVLMTGAVLVASTTFAKSAREAFSIRDPKGKQVIGTSDVTCAALGKDAAGKEVATFKVNDEAAARMNEVTKNNIGKKLGIYVCGKKINEPKIAGEISSKTVMAIGLEAKDKDCLGKAFQLKEKCED